eukprot:1392499-Amorphochlora_amoeboformis.AAC.1
MLAQRSSSPAIGSGLPACRAVGSRPIVQGLVEAHLDYTTWIMTNLVETKWGQLELLERTRIRGSSAA